MRLIHLLPASRYYVPLLLLLLSSCAIRRTGHISTPPPPGVSLKDGRILSCPTPEVSAMYTETREYKTGTGSIGILRPTIYCADSAIRLRSVQSFTLAGKHFANITGKKFACRIGEGNIDLYATIVHSNVPLGGYGITDQTITYSRLLPDTGSITLGRRSFPYFKKKKTFLGYLFNLNITKDGTAYRHTHVNTYICPSGAPHIATLNYKHLAALASPHNPWLTKAHTWRYTAPIAATAGIGALLAGMVLASAHNGNSPSDPSIRTGNVLGYCGCALLIAKPFLHRHYRNCLYRAINYENTH